jgi:hypothetical protein
MPSIAVVAWDERVRVANVGISAVKIKLWLCNYQSQHGLRTKRIHRVHFCFSLLGMYLYTVTLHPCTTFEDSFEGLVIFGSFVLGFGCVCENPLAQSVHFKVCVISAFLTVLKYFLSNLGEAGNCQCAFYTAANAGDSLALAAA